MLDSLPITLLVGTALGFLSGLGIGGGSLLILWLNLVLGLDPQTARAINLLFFLPSALIACIFRLRQEQLEIRPLLPAIAAGCISAAVFSWVSSNVNTQMLKKGFGILLLIAGARELFYRPRKPR